MARKKNTNDDTNMVEQVQVEPETKSEVEVKTDTEVIQEQPQVRIKKQLDRNMLVTVANFTNGTLIYISPKSGATWRLEGFGQTDEMEVSELMTMRSAYPKFLSEPWLVILDDDVVNYFGLADMYSKMVMPNNFDKVLNLDGDKLRLFLEKAPLGMKNVVISRVKQMISQGNFDSMSKKAVIEEVCHVSFDD